MTMFTTCLLYTSRFPYPTGEAADDATCWTADDCHSTDIILSEPQRALIRRTVDSTAVSYTHLDVYKRQAITTPLDRFVEDGSYLRISTITLGYTLPKKWLSKAFISNLRLYCTLNNPFTITNYSGYDRCV